MTSSPLPPAVFVDRDGTLIEDVHYPRDPDRVRFLEGAIEGLTRLSAAGFKLVVVSNQSGIGRGIISAAQARAVHDRFTAGLDRAGVTLAAVRYCPHDPSEGCLCRKPQPGLILDAASDLGLDLRASFMVGDKASDIEAGTRAGCRTILLGSCAAADGAEHSARTWEDAVGFILGARAAA